MTLLLLVLTLAALVAIGIGVGYLRGAARPALTGGVGEQARQWFGTLRGPRALGAGLVAGGALVLILALVLRP